MEIRSVTFLVDPNEPIDDVPPAVADVRTAFREAGYRLQTVRLATTPFPLWLRHSDQVSDLVAWCREAAIDYLALGPVRLTDSTTHLDQLPGIMAKHGMVFASAEVANTRGQIDTGRASEVARLVKELALVRPDGFANLFFAATANCRPGSPFFPVSYHDGGPPCLAIATEAANLAVSALKNSGSLVAAREKLVAAIEKEAGNLAAVANIVSERHGLAFGGIDSSLAPYPEESRSLGAAIEALGVPAVGGHGSLFAATLLAECIDRARFPRCGFSGLMMPVLEDAILARRASDGILTVNDLLLYSAVCGTGLDTVPLPGDVGQDELTGILLDLGALAARLDKPLTARLMPMPGLSAGDPVEFDFEYFADSRVMDIKGVGLDVPLAGRELIVFQPRQNCG